MVQGTSAYRAVQLYKATVTNSLQTCGVLPDLGEKEDQGPSNHNS